MSTQGIQRQLLGRIAVAVLVGLATIAMAVPLAKASASGEPAAQPTTKEECKKGGWTTFAYTGFRNEGDCIKFVQTGAFTCRDALGCVAYDDDDPIRVATSFATSGPAAFLGIDSLRGVELALDRLGPLRGRTVELSNFDSLCSAAGGEAAADAITTDADLVAVLGTSCSNAASTAAPILSAAGFTMISPSSTNPSLTDPATHSPGYFRTVDNDAGQVAAIADFFWARGATTAALIVVPDQYGSTLGAEFSTHFDALGGSTLSTATVEFDGSNVADAVANAMSNGVPDVIVIIAYEPNGSALVNEIRSIPALNDTALAATDALLNGEFFGNAGPNATGIAFSTLDNSFTASAAYGVFINDYIAEFGPPTSPFHAMAADAASLLLDAVSRVGVIDGDGTLHIGRQALRDAVQATPGLDGLTGAITCTQFGDCGAAGHTVVIPVP